MLISLILLFLLCIQHINCSKEKHYSDDDLPDFEFDDTETSNSQVSQLSRKSSNHQLDFSDFDDFFIDDGNEPEDSPPSHLYDIKLKEKILKSAILRALSTKELKYKFSEVLPLLRHLSKAQRMVFSSIISAQINGGRSFSFDEVSDHFLKLFFINLINLTQLAIFTS